MFDGFGKLPGCFVTSDASGLTQRPFKVLKGKRFYSTFLVYVYIYIYINKIFGCPANVFVNSMHSSFLTGVKRLTNNECKSFVTLSWVSRFNIIYIYIYIILYIAYSQCLDPAC